MVILGHIQCDGCCKPPCQPITAPISASFACMHSFVSICHVSLNSHLEVWLTLNAEFHRQMTGESFWLGDLFWITYSYKLQGWLTQIGHKFNRGKGVVILIHHSGPDFDMACPLNSPFKMEIMSKPSIFGCSKDTVQKNKTKECELNGSPPPSPSFTAALSCG